MYDVGSSLLSGSVAKEIGLLTLGLLFYSLENASMTVPWTYSTYLSFISC